MSTTKDLGFKEYLTKSYKNMKNFIRESKIPKRKEFTEQLRINMVGVCLLGIFGYIIKVVHIPINNILVGSGN